MLCCRHDFVVVETIDFYADEDAELPPPMSQRHVILLNKAQQLEDEQEEAAAAADDAGRQEVSISSAKANFHISTAAPHTPITPEEVGIAVCLKEVWRGASKETSCNTNLIIWNEYVGKLPCFGKLLRCRFLCRAPE